MVRIARKGVEPKDRLGRHRWKAERTIAWLDGCRRLRVRYKRSSERFFAFGLLACCRLAFNRYTDRTTTPGPRHSAGMTGSRAGDAPVTSIPSPCPPG
jgi:Transposase DDE domain